MSEQWWFCHQFLEVPSRVFWVFAIGRIFRLFVFDFFFRWRNHSGKFNFANLIPNQTSFTLNWQLSLNKLGKRKWTVNCKHVSKSLQFFFSLNIVYVPFLLLFFSKMFKNLPKTHRLLFKNFRFPYVTKTAFFLVWLFLETWFECISFWSLIQD